MWRSAPPAKSLGGDDANDSSSGGEVDIDDPGQGVEVHTGSVLSAEERQKLKQVFYDAETVFDSELRPLSDTILSSSTGPKLVGTRWIVQIEDGDEAMGVAVSRDGTIVAAACRNGTARLLAADDGRPLGSLQLGPPGSGSSLGACTCLRFRPEPDNARTRNVLAVGKGRGVYRCHATTGQELFATFEGDNEVLGLDYSSNGMRLASVGSDASVRVYDEGARALEVTFEAASVSGMGHSSNVYGAAWERGPGDAVLVTAGWDNSICIWDRRQRARVGSMFGAYVCGDALDLRGNEVLSGSWRDQSPLQLWDVRMRRLLTNYTTLVGVDEGSMRLYAAKLSPVGPGKGQDSGLIAAGGTAVLPCVRTLTYDGRPMHNIVVPSAVHAVCFDDVPGPVQQIAIACAEHMCLAQVPRL